MENKCRELGIHLRFPVSASVSIMPSRTRTYMLGKRPVRKKDRCIVLKLLRLIIRDVNPHSYVIVVNSVSESCCHELVQGELHCFFVV
jgi:hypothetical protein